MRRNTTIEALRSVDPTSLLSIIENGIEVEKMNLEALELLGDDLKVIQTKRRITQAKIFSLIITGDL